MYAILQHLLIICILFCSLASSFKIILYLISIRERTTTTRDERYSEKQKNTQDGLEPVVSTWMELAQCRCKSKRVTHIY